MFEAKDDLFFKLGQRAHRALLDFHSWHSCWWKSKVQMLWSKVHCFSAVFLFSCGKSHSVGFSADSRSLSAAQRWWLIEVTQSRRPQPFRKAWGEGGSGRSHWASSTEGWYGRKLCVRTSSCKDFPAFIHLDVSVRFAVNLWCSAAKS